MRSCLLLLFLTVVLSSCQPKKQRQVTRGLYYWETNLNLSDKEQSVMNSLNAEFLYTRFFDVQLGSDGKPVPSAVINFGENLPDQKIVPCVYITQEALNALSWRDLGYYARNIVKLIQQKANEITLEPREIQIDCDWTRHNKKLYFALLKKIKGQPYLQNKTLSVTIRLHQIKYFQKTGIPPVDKGLLMVYNLNDLKNSKVDNSIISLKTAKAYLSYLPEYPFELDVALPIYSWALLFEEKVLNQAPRKFKGILRGIDLKDLKNHALFRNTRENRYIVHKDTVYKSFSLEKGELIRFEQADFKTVHQVAQYLSSVLTEDSLSVLLYQCDLSNFKKFTKDEMEKIFTDFN